MKTLYKMLKDFWNNEEGMETSEYAVVGTLIAVGTVAAFTGLQGGITRAIAAITAVLPAA